jgi:hypothetical protein
MKAGGYAISAASGCATVQKVTLWSDRVNDQMEQQALDSGVSYEEWRELHPNKRFIWGDQNLRR